MGECNQMPKTELSIVIASMTRGSSAVYYLRKYFDGTVSYSGSRRNSDAP